MRRIISLLFLVILITTLFNSCNHFEKSDDELIRARIDCFLEAYNSGDMDGVLDCLDSKTRNTLKSSFSLIEAFGGKLSGIGGITLSDLFGAGVGTMSDGDILTVNIIEVNIKDKTNAFVNVIMSYEDKIQEFSDKAVFTLVKEEGDWYIKNFEEK